jgi:hypothetical protein
MSRIIHFNVGGTLFSCYESTIQKSSKLWTVKQSVKFIDRINSEVIFIDRSAKIFEHVLNYLRDPTYLYPKKYLSELQYYNVTYDENLIREGMNRDESY